MATTSWTSAKTTPPDDEELKVVWLREGWMGMDNYVDGSWQSFGDEGMVILWRDSPDVPTEAELQRAG